MKALHVLCSLAFLTTHGKSELPDFVRYAYACDDIHGTSYSLECFMGEFGKEHHGRIETLFEKRSQEGGHRSRSLWMRCRFGTRGWEAGPSLFNKGELFWKETTNALFSGGSRIGQGETNRVGVSVSREFLRRRQKTEFAEFNFQTNCLAGLVPDIKGFGGEMSGAGLKTGMPVSGNWGDAVYWQHSIEPDSPMDVNFQDLYFTPLRHLRCTVRCRGIVARINKNENTAVLWPSWSLEDFRPGGNPIDSLLLNNFSIPLQFTPDVHDGDLDPALNGKVVEVEGRVSTVDGPGDVWGELAGLGTGLRCCRIVKTPANISGVRRAPTCRYMAPCREFKLRLQISMDKYYLVHCYGSSLRMAPLGDRSRQMVPLHGTRRDEEGMLQIWSLLRKIEGILAERFQKDPCFDGCMCAARDFSEIPDLQLSKNECPDLIPVVEALFAIVNQDEQ